MPRWYKPERSKRWHHQYDHVQKGHNFLYLPVNLKYFDDEFYKEFLVERISGIGLFKKILRV